MPGFYNADLDQLAHQLTLSPRRLRMEQIDNVANLLSLVEEDRAYPYDWVCYHITKYARRGPDTGPAIPGRALIADLVRLVEHISQKANFTAAEVAEPCLTQDEAAAELHVSPKTVRRWRARGLLGIRVLGEDGVGRLLIPRRFVARFVERNRALVEKAASFTQLTDEERRNIIERAQTLLSQRRMKLHETARIISAETGRAVETIRYTLRRFDRANKGRALFGVKGQPRLTRREDAIWNAHAAGDSVGTLAAAFETTTDEIERVLREVQVRRWREQPITYVHHELFDAPNARALILDAPEPAGEAAEAFRPPPELPAYIRSLYEVPLLTAEQEQDLFRRYNFVKYLAARQIRKLDPCHVTAAEVNDVQALIVQQEALRQRIIRANLRLVISVAKKHVGWSTQFFEVVSDGNMSLMRAVEKFDFSRGFRFSTYASWAIMKNYARTIPEQHFRLSRCITGQDEILAAAPDHREPEHPQHDAEQVRRMLKQGLAELSERERDVVSARFGLFEEKEAKTLQEIGDRYGVTKERIRQIERRAIKKLKAVLSPSLADMVAA
ncbi:MAG: sigma-70 family RNA polymerase sigma factor [Phycisphaerales bacterium]|nr:MAG: sigma-70 family RNA polymerase sigma factor [Phycisphaerales bacterium]